MSSDIPTSHDALIERVRQHAATVESAWRSGEPARLPEGLNACDAALKEVQSAVVKTGPDAVTALPVALARLTRDLWLQRGHMLDALANMKGDPALVVEALRSYDQAINLGRQMGDEPGVLAVAWISRGKALQRLASPDAMKEALRCFEETIALIGEPSEAMPLDLRNTLGAALMSRAGLLLRDQDPAVRSEALRTMERGVACLQTCSGHAMAQRNLASAWTNLGLLRQESGDIQGAVAAQEHALAVVDALYSADPDTMAGERATILLNLGQARCAAQVPQAGLENLRAAIKLAEPYAAGNPSAADTVLRARHALGVTLSAQLSAAQPDAATRSAWLSEASDAVEDGLALVQGWGERAGWFAEIATRLFELGAWFYRTQQPRFLAEFLLEHVGEDPIRARIAGATVTQAREAITRQSFGVSGDALDLLQGLGQVEARLKELAAKA